MENMKSGYLLMISERWLSSRIKMLSSCLVFIIATFCILERNSIQAGLAALILTYSLNFSDTMTILVRGSCRLENSCVSLERIFDFINLKSEAEWSKPLLGKEWPSKGNIKFQSFVTRYRPDLEPVLKGIDLNIEPKEKIGICGRTGAGKSSLILSLLRIVEPTEGHILIDGIRICDIGLHELRSQIAIIPQVILKCYLILYEYSKV